MLALTQALHSTTYHLCHKERRAIWQPHGLLSGVSAGVSRPALPQVRCPMHPWAHTPCHVWHVPSGCPLAPPAAACLLPHVHVGSHPMPCVACASGCHLAPLLLHVCCHMYTLGHTPCHVWHVLQGVTWHPCCCMFAAPCISWVTPHAVCGAALVSPATPCCCMFAASCWCGHQSLLQCLTAACGHQVLAQHQRINPGICCVCVISNQVDALQAQCTHTRVRQCSNTQDDAVLIYIKAATPIAGCNAELNHVTCSVQ
jgi:hypothetical protein